MKKNNLLFSFILFLIGSVFCINAQTNSAENINSLLEKKRDYNKNNGTGYRIQLYNGLESQARKLKFRFQSNHPGVYTKLTYVSPEWKIQVGNYKTQLHADRALNKLREEFSGAIVVPM